MKLLLIEQEKALNAPFYEVPECLPILDAFEGHYKKVGFHKPWIGYFVANEAGEVVGGCGYKGRPNNGMVEVSYATFTDYQRQGVATEICRQLVLLAGQTDPAIRVTARTLPDNQASMGVLEKNGFVCIGTVHDEEDGEVLEWELKQ
jgi:[ribosomal protein S5]-alanine N-acetyltransferase